MDKLTETLPHPIPADSFLRCQACGITYDDICYLNLWWEADEDDEWEDTSPAVLVCKADPCKQVILDHERLYAEMPWSRGGPGRFMLVCGTCPHREGTTCTHPKLTANGGEGLLVTASQILPSVHINRGPGRSGWLPFTPATKCEGNPDGGA